MKDKFWSSGAVAVGLLMCSLTCQLAFSQTSGSVSGTVLDNTGAALPSVSLTLTNVNTNESRTQTSSAAGEYNFREILPGTYQITAEKTGFSTLTVRSVVVQVDTPLHRNITMQVGARTENITVEASSNVVNTESAALGEVISAEKIAQLPLNGRNFLQLATLSAGVNPPAIQSFGSTTQANSGGRPSLTISVSGSREISSDFLFDGIPSRQDFYGAVGVEPPVDSIIEFKVQRGYFSPEFGQPAAVNVVIKSGDNGFHGGAWEFFRNDVLDARNYFDVLDRKPPYHQNQFGANAGGRIIKNKLFYFGDWEQLRIRQSSTGFAVVPTTAELSGDFTGLPTIYDPATYNPATNTRQPFPNNRIDPSRISSFAAKYNSLIPAPNGAPNPTLGGANFFKQIGLIQNDLKFDIKIDYVTSSRDRFFGRYSYDYSDQTNTAVLPLNDNISPLHAQNAVGSWLHVFSSTAINDFTIGLNRAFLSSGAPADPTAVPNLPGLFGLTNLNQIPQCNAAPTASITGFAAFGYSFGNCINNGNTDKIFLDNFNLIRGRHSLSMGGQLIRVNHKDTDSSSGNGRLTFTGQYTGNPATNVAGNAVADYLLGAAATASGSAPTQPAYINYWAPSSYINDDFRVSSKLSVNMGLRWQFQQPMVEKHNRMGQFDFATGTIWYAGDPGRPREVLSRHYADFAPRLGIAYAITNNWVIRASGGVFYDRLPGNEEAFTFTQFPRFACSSGLSGDLRVPSINISQLFPQCTPATVGQSLFVLADRKDPYLDMWTVSTQRTLPGNVLVELAYIGSKGTHLSKGVNANPAPNPPAPGNTLPLQQRRIYPQYGFILADEGIGNSEYEGLQLTVRKQTSHGLSFLSGYTYSKSLDNDSFDAQAIRNYNLHSLDKGRSQFDLRHRFVFSGTYELPVGKNLTGLSKTAVAGWALDAVVSLQSGLPISPTTSTDFSNTGAIFNPRPNRICNGNLPADQRTQQRWFDTSCFVNPLPNTYGNSGWGVLDFAGAINTDLAIAKDFTLNEGRQKFQFRSEFFNAFNHVNWQLPRSTVGSFTRVGDPGEGVITAALPGRIIQFGLKFLW